MHAFEAVLGFNHCNAPRAYQISAKSGNAWLRVIVNDLTNFPDHFLEGGAQ